MSETTCAQLVDLLDGAHVLGDPATAVSGSTHNSREVASGDLFCCVVGASHDGHEFGAAAVASGAAALLVERALDVDVAQVVVPSVREAMGRAAALIAGDPSRSMEVIGITGTNGKTTVAHLVSSLSNSLGVPTEVIGTLTGVRTTPEGPELQRLLADFAGRGVQRVAMEVSSHALDLHRVDGTRFAVAVFTNLGVDHLDHHGTVEQYFAAKSRLFDPGLAARAVVNLDDVHGRLLRDAAAVPTSTYSLSDVDVIERSSTSTRFAWRGQRCELPLVGDFNVSNAIAALESLVALGEDPAALATALRDVTAPPGRLERIDEGQPFSVFVDFAHTPDALGAALESVRGVADGSVRVVFGCGGDRDRSKRPEMGRVAAEQADEVTVTSDNSRSESPTEIAAEIVAGIRDTPVTITVDRAAAIAEVLAGAQPGDAVLIAGKGHETSQVDGDTVVEFDDREVARQALRSLGYGSGSTATTGAAQ